MKKSKYNESQIISILKEAESGVPVTELCRKHGMSDASFYNWRAKYGGMDVSMMKRMKELEEDDVQEVLISRAQDAQERLIVV